MSRKWLSRLFFRIRSAARWLIDTNVSMLSLLVVAIVTAVVCGSIAWPSSHPLRRGVSGQQPTLRSVLFAAELRVPPMAGFYDGARYMPWADQIALSTRPVDECFDTEMSPRELSCGGNVRIQIPDVQWERSEWKAAGFDPDEFVPQPVPWCALTPADSAGWSEVTCRQPWCVSMSNGGGDVRCLPSPPKPVRVKGPARATFAALLYDDLRERRSLGVPA